MSDHCQIPDCIEKLFAASHCGVGFLGGSLTTGVGASNTARTSWRARFVEYLYQEYHPKYHSQVSEIMGAVGASESYVTAFTLERNITPNRPDLTLVEFCVNDRGCPDPALVQKGIEGIVRQLLLAKDPSNVMLLGAGVRSGDVSHAIHRQVAEYYDLPFVDMQGYLFAQLKERGQSWNDISIEFVENDGCHLSDYGNVLCFAAIRECFEEQVRLFWEGKRKPRRAPVPPPLFSDEFQFTRLIDPARPTNGLTLAGNWARKPEGHVPWYFDNLLAGRPGAKLTLEFDGTAVAVFGLMYHNGLKLEAVLDGKEIAGPYLRHFIEFGKGMVLAHGLPCGKHVLELTVGAASRRHNKLGNPTAAIGYIGVAGKTPVAAAP